MPEFSELGTGIVSTFMAAVNGVPSTPPFEDPEVPFSSFQDELSARGKVNEPLKSTPSSERSSSFGPDGSKILADSKLFQVLKATTEGDIQPNHVSYFHTSNTSELTPSGFLKLQPTNY
eukprot:GHVP01042590.1.p1 GENE.GHVP01042590.1~~GHVP01042590.1.p1  ORF type:complete len:130 (+),score=26.33 GHVP01042590.1:35-391(+)